LTKTITTDDLTICKIDSSLGLLRYCTLAPC